MELLQWMFADLPEQNLLWPGRREREKRGPSAPTAVGPMAAGPTAVGPTAAGPTAAGPMAAALTAPYSGERRLDGISATELLRGT